MNDIEIIEATIEFLLPLLATYWNKIENGQPLTPIEWKTYMIYARAAKKLDEDLAAAKNNTFTPPPFWNNIRNLTL